MQDYLLTNYIALGAARLSEKNMENILAKTVKENGNIDLNELSWKQVVALLGAWDSSFARNENTSFSEMVKRCYKSRPWHENANIIYLHRNNQKTTILPHACYNLDEAEEDMIFNLLKKQFLQKL
jgi:hypothetical protein